MSKSVRNFMDKVTGTRSLINVLKGQVKLVNKVAKSKLGKVVIMAAAIYFGGAALAGAMGSGAAAATGASGWAGAQAGLSAAWSGLGAASSAAMAGNFAEAGSALSTGFAGGAGAVQTAGAASPLATAGGASGMTNAAAVGADFGAMNAGPAGAGAMGAGTPAVQTASLVNPAATTGGPLTGAWNAQAAQATQAALPVKTAPGILSSIASSPYTAPALIQAGGSMLNSLGNAKAAQDAYQRQLDDRQAEIDRYNRNIGVYLPRRA